MTMIESNACSLIILWYGFNCAHNHPGAFAINMSLRLGYRNMHNFKAMLCSFYNTKIYARLVPYVTWYTVRRRKSQCSVTIYGGQGLILISKTNMRSKTMHTTGDWIVRKLSLSCDYHWPAFLWGIAVLNVLRSKQMTTISRTTFSKGFFVNEKCMNFD